MRYKDADALIKEIEENKFNWIDENDKSFLINLINRQPGYDIENVIERLKEASEKNFEEYKKLKQEKSGLNAMVWRSDLYSIASSCYDHAVNIVRGNTE